MKKLLASFLVISFVLWTLPLGVFIKPSQEKMACDGQRAMCMCHAWVPQSSDKAMEAAVALKAGPSTNKESPPGSGVNYFVTSTPIVPLYTPFISHFENQYFAYSNPSVAALEYVPKV